MKTVIFSIVLIVGSINVGMTQSSKPASDSVRINDERSRISKELSQLRDSIAQTIKSFNSKIRKASADRKLKLENASTDLTEYMNRVKSDLQETSLTAVNAWTMESVTRIRSNTIATRREYYRIRGIDRK